MDRPKKITIHFLGAARTVTGSKFLVDTGARKIMIDCGLFQGPRALRRLNRDDFPVDASEIDTVLLTHGHLDHTGYLPKLLRMGFDGLVRGTGPSLEIAGIILRDSARIQEEEAEKANREGYSRHKPAIPLYTVQDAEMAISRFRAVPVGQWIELYPEIRARFRYNGHIIGATFIELEVFGKRLVFSGDVGRQDDLLMRPPERPERADLLVVESTYGDRLHPEQDLEKSLQRIILRSIEKGGPLIIPSFAVERTQLLMYHLWKLQQKKRIPDIPIIMDSPMGANVLKVFHNTVGWHKLSPDECTEMCKRFHITKSFRETMTWVNVSMPRIVIAGSGMVSGGRVLTYLEAYLGDPDTTIMLAGYQAEGTRGRALLEGARELKIFGKHYPVRAEVIDLQVLSAHADQAELIDWMGAISDPPERVFIVHGETPAPEALREKIRETYGWNSEIPELYDKIEITL